MIICSRGVTQEFRERDRDEVVPSLRCCNSYSFRLLIFIRINRSPQLVYIGHLPDGVVLPLQVGIIVYRFNLWMFPQTRKESSSAKPQALHSLICCQQFILLACHLEPPQVSSDISIPLDVQYVKKYNKYSNFYCVIRLGPIDILHEVYSVTQSQSQTCRTVT